MSVEWSLARNDFSLIPLSLLRIVATESRKRRNIPQTCFYEITAFRGGAEIKFRWKKSHWSFRRAYPRFSIRTRRGRISNWLSYNRHARADYVACRMWRIFFSYISCCFLHEKLGFYTNPQSSQNECIQSNARGRFMTDNYEARR